jgi:hypothetical protein
MCAQQCSARAAGDLRFLRRQSGSINQLWRRCPASAAAGLECRWKLLPFGTGKTIWEIIACEIFVSLFKIFFS